MAKKKTTEQYIEEVNIVHDFEFTYSKATYIGSSKLIIVTCELHGDFEIIANNHKNGRGCPTCGNLRRGKEHKKSKEHFLNTFYNKHGKTQYDYRNFKNEGSGVNFDIICKEHGPFPQSPSVHAKGHGCPTCAIEKNTAKATKPKEDFLIEAFKVQGNTYNLEDCNYVDRRTKIQAECNIHGKFSITPKNFLKGRGCPKCSKIRVANDRRSTKEEIVEHSNNAHNNRYGYEKAIFVDSSTKMEVTCSVHKEFWVTPNNHISKLSGCPKCSTTGPSRVEQEVFDFLNSNVPAIQSDQSLLDGKREIDIIIPSKKLAIEFNGLRWHSELFKDKNYHLNKTKECKEKGYQLIHIFEDEWTNKKEIVKSRLLNLIGATTEKVYARKCEIKEVPTKVKSKFLDENHLQGKVGSQINLGLYYKDTLVSIMTFGKLRKNLGQNHKEGSWELLRFCNKLDTTVIGGASKLLKHFKISHSYEEIVSYADLRWSNGNLYDKLGFEKLHESVPNYFYTMGNVREARFKYRKDILVAEGFDKNKTEKQIMQERGYMRIYDCGNIKFKLNK